MVGFEVLITIVYVLPKLLMYDFFFSKENKEEHLLSFFFTFYVLTKYPRSNLFFNSKAIIITKLTTGLHRKTITHLKQEANLLN